MAPNVNKPVDVQQRAADVDRKLQIYGIITAFKAGKIPSNRQIDVALNSFLESKALSDSSGQLSTEGQELVKDFREVVTQAKNLLLSKNDGNLLQDFIWQTQHFDPKKLSAPNAPVKKEQAQQHGNQALEGLRTLGTLIITNGQFRKLLNDATILLRDMAGDAALQVASTIRPSQEDLQQVDRPAEDNVWYEAPNLSKDKARGKFHEYYKGDPRQDIKVAAQQGTSQAPADAPLDTSGVANIAAVSKDAVKQNVAKNVDNETKEQTKARIQEYRERAREYFNRKMPQERREQIVWRLKKMILECQQHPDYSRAIRTLFDLAEQYGDHATQLARGGTDTVKDAHSSLAQAERDLRTLIERFANGTSTSDLWRSIRAIYDDADRDPRLKQWFKDLHVYIRRCFEEQGFILEDESNVEWDGLYDEGRYLLRERYRHHTDRVVDEIRFLADQFDQDPQNKAFAASLTKLFTRLGNDENGKTTFKPHLVKDLTRVILPSAIQHVAYVPLPRIEYSDADVDAVIDNIVLESDNFMPNVLEIASENYMRFGRRDATSRQRHSLDIHVSGIQLDLRDVSYYIKRKRGFPSISDTGVANLLLAGEGFTFRLRLSSSTDEADKKPRTSFFQVDKVDVTIHNLQVKLIKSQHKLLFSLIKPLFMRMLRPALERALEKTIRDQAGQLDSLIYDIKQEADRSKQAAYSRRRQPGEEPVRPPNAYRRYAAAIQRQVLLRGKKAQAAAASAQAAGRKVNYAVTREESIFPNVKLPGGIADKATDLRARAREGDKWESPVFSIGSAAPSKDVPPAPRIVSKTHERVLSSTSVKKANFNGQEKQEEEKSYGQGQHQHLRKDSGAVVDGNNDIYGEESALKKPNLNEGFQAQQPVFDPTTRAVW